MFPLEKSLAEQDDRFCGPVDASVSGVLRVTLVRGITRSRDMDATLADHETYDGTAVMIVLI